MANTFTFANLTLTDADIYGGINFVHDLNVGEEFSIGNTASASVSFVTDTQLPLYDQDQTNGTFTWTQNSISRGRFYITEVVKNQGKYTVTAYDAMILLDVDISALSLTYPTTVSALASSIATYIGCTVSGTVTNGTLAVISLDPDMKIRQLLGYIAEASGCSVKIDGSDHLCFMYYASSGISITASQYKENGLDAADYTVAAIDNVTIFDVAGMVQATSGAGTNTLFIQCNPLLYEATNTEAAAILAVVDSFVYTPLRCEMFVENGLEIGTTATVGGLTTMVMHIESSEQGAVVSCVGNATRDALNKSIEVIVNEAKATADQAQATVGALNQHFWYVSSGADSGAHIAEIPKTQWDVTPSGGNLLARSTGIAVRDGMTELAEFGSNMRIGPTSNTSGDNEYPSSYLLITQDAQSGTRLKFIGSVGSRLLGYIESLNYLTSNDDYRELSIVGPYGNSNSPRITIDYDGSSNARGIDLWVSNSKRIYISNTGATNIAGSCFFDSDVTIRGHSSAIGTLLTASSSSNHSLASGTSFVSLNSATDAVLSLPPGSWVITGLVTFGANATGRRAVQLYAGSTAFAATRVISPAVNGETTQLMTTLLVTTSASSSSVYLQAYQNSGSTLNAGTNLRAIRIA